MLGDNLFTKGLIDQLRAAANRHQGGTVRLSGAHPERYGVVEFNDSGTVIRRGEGPARSRYAGLYFYDAS